MPKKPKVQQQPKETVATQSQKLNAVETPVVVETEQAETVPTMLEIDEDSLQGGTSCQGTAKVRNKKVLLYDNNILVYALELEINNMVVNYFVNADGYGLIKTGDTLEIEYMMYTPKEDTVYYLVNSVKTIVE